MSDCDTLLNSLYLTTAILGLLLVISEFIGWSSCHYGGILDFFRKLCAKPDPPPQTKVTVSQQEFTKHENAKIEDRRKVYKISKDIAIEI